MTVRIGDLELPADVLTSVLIAYGGRGMGKTNLAAVLAEQLARRRLRWAWLDPIGVAWGIRHSADGKGPGVTCLVLGGPHGDIPIQSNGGAAVADVVVEESVNVLVDFSRKPGGEMWTIGEKVRFATDYARRLFQRQGDLAGGRRREPLLQILDEAARYIPEQIPAGAAELAHCVAAWEQLVEEGRNVGLGAFLITQRSARMKKSVSELADAMFAFRTVGPNSLAAIVDWLGTHVPRERSRPLAEQVRALERGSALVVSPGWLQLERVCRIPLRETFDSSATPKPGERARTARGAGARPDLEAIRTRMAETIARVEAEDPKKLRARIAELERELAKKPKAEPAPVKPPKRVEVPVLTVAERKLVARFLELVPSVHRIAGAIVLATTEKPKSYVQLGREETWGTPAGAKASAPAPARPLAPAPRRDPDEPNGELGAGPRRMLFAVAARHPEPITKDQLGILSNFARSGGTFRTYLPALVRAGLIAVNGESVVLTEHGVVAAGDAVGRVVDPQGVREMWRNALGAGERRMFDALLEAYPVSMTRDQLGEASGFVATGGTFRTYFPKLKRLGLLLIEHGEISAHPNLFGA